MIISEGVLVLELWGKIGYNPKWKHWYVKGKWQGKRRYFSQIPTQSGSLIPCKTKELAQLLQHDISREIQFGTFNPARYKRSNPLHLEVYSKKWLELIKPSISSATWDDYESSLRLHILPVLGKEYIPDINKDKLTALLNGINRKPKGKKNVMGCLHKLLNDAFDSGYMSQFPKFPKFTGKHEIKPPENIDYIESDQQQEIMNHIPAGDKPIFEFMVLTGCRPSEARAFRKKDIRKDEIIFAKTFGRKGEIKEVKGKKVMNWPMTEGLKELFASMPGNLTPWVFPNPRTGKPYSKNINRTWNKACKKAGIEIRLNNATRHSFATQMLNAGETEGTVSRLLRHSDPRMLKKYGEYRMSALKSIVDKVQSLAKG